MDSILQQLTQATTKTQAHQLVSAAISDPRVVGFQELFSSPLLHDLLESEPNSEDSKYCNTLEVFTFGVFDDYMEHRELLIELLVPQVVKLRVLTLLSACVSKTQISYDELTSLLHVDTVAEAESIIITAIQNQHIDAELYSAEQHVQIRAFAGRDVILPQQSLRIVDAEKNSVARLEDLALILDNWSSVNVLKTSGLVADTEALLNGNQERV
ncbi:hypothetical protein BABINDRAFT_7579 [Babjeviella inositovora NRRL Y-12698]|uniref:PCI domain-containing protein n=1 Tax=Babjeviella inositovora NRRL Y-12698 TaxID=984486 RepID=A0A1E3QR33_9ASCO|nr:uncharacterized protein BABINDRAFT_7579 [Babjeviella inositovora NRRL Y-12698]ODQ80098.1 hypothetical protein BABINDRAFT_7579 [Babjeviella inositovora NRRL Y-12698]